jgi:hypothetical protein
MPLDAAGMQRLREMRGKKKSSEKKGSSGKKSKKSSEGKEKKMLLKEHTKLVKVLKEKKPKALKSELKMQEKELAMLKKK